MLIRAKESLHVESILFSYITDADITDADVVVKCLLLTSLLSIVGAAISAAGSESDVLDELVAEMVAVPSIGIEGMRDRIRSSETDNLSLTIIHFASLFQDWRRS